MKIGSPDPRHVPTATKKYAASTSAGWLLEVSSAGLGRFTLQFVSFASRPLRSVKSMANGGDERILLSLEASIAPH